MPVDNRTRAYVLFETFGDYTLTSKRDDFTECLIASTDGKRVFKEARDLARENRGNDSMKYVVFVYGSKDGVIRKRIIYDCLHNRKYIKRYWL